MRDKLVSKKVIMIDGQPSIWCPGCKNLHIFDVNGPVFRPRAQWTFDENYDAPTFNPSMLVNQHSARNRCHSWVRAGKIEFLVDCFHDLKGTTVEVPNIPEHVVTFFDED